MQQDGDSYFNAAYCLEHGLGTDRNLTWAAELYTSAAEKFGHFDSVNMIGKEHARVHGVESAEAV